MLQNYLSGFARLGGVVTFTVPERCASRDSVFDNLYRKAITARDNINRFFPSSTLIIITLYFIAYRAAQTIRQFFFL